MSAPTNQPIDKQSGILAILARPFWMFLGNFALLICAANILMGESSSTRTSDIIFWGAVAAMIIVRFLDIKFLNGLTATGEPATLAQWRKYAIMLIICSGIIWAAAHAAVYLFKS
ncbi:MAG: hypothetical protein MUP16_03665 [Sedimentisphaerales bacterium]|nr:hypothetical protein [Sedimentisphaerales bacterium]